MVDFSPIQACNLNHRVCKKTCFSLRAQGLDYDTVQSNETAMTELDDRVYANLLSLFGIEREKVGAGLRLTADG